MYAVGDKVVHPMHGAGVIEGIREIEIVGKKSKYYAVRFAMGSMVTNIPIENCENIGIRDVIDKNEAKKVLECFRDLPVTDDSNWNKRQRENMLRIKSGDIYQVLGVLKDLMFRERTKGLSTSERKTLGSARQIVVSELVLSDVAEEVDIENIMQDTIEALI
ncbi:MAG: CarD family transcriptional regulator [Clostridia bacterium]|nr:CarD family transcriptional regulator [Clostridia bacterium]